MALRGWDGTMEAQIVTEIGTRVTGSEASRSLEGMGVLRAWFR